MKQSKTFDADMARVVLSKCKEVLVKPRVSAYTPQSLVEVVYGILSISFDQKHFEKEMFLEYSSKPWWLSEDLDYVTATTRLKKLVSNLEGELSS